MRTVPQLTKLAVVSFLWLILMDAGLNFLFRMPDAKYVQYANFLQKYFEYGRSAEGKMLHLTRESTDDTAAITLTGWYDRVLSEALPNKDPDKIGVTIYGMSFSGRLADAVQRTSDKLNSTQITAPSAPANWSLGAYRRNNADTNKYVVLTFMSDNVKSLNSTTAATTGVDFALPYTMDRFVTRNGAIDTITPPHETFSAYTSTLLNEESRKEYIGWLEENDPNFDPIIFKRNWADKSAFLRLLRRSYGKLRIQRRESQSLSPSGFDPDNRDIQTAGLIAREFKRIAEDRGQVPIVFIVNNIGYGDHLFQALKPMIESEELLYLSTHTIADSGDPSNFLPDSHFKDENDDKFARRLEEIILGDLN